MMDTCKQQSLDIMTVIEDWKLTIVSYKTIVVNKNRSLQVARLIDNVLGRGRQPQAANRMLVPEKYGCGGLSLILPLGQIVPPSPTFSLFSLSCSSLFSFSVH
jgi:hypothetical protein